MSHFFRNPLVWCCALACLALPALGQTNVLTSNYDNQRTNSNPRETILNPGTVNPSTFGKIGALPVDGQIYAQPLYAGGVAINGAGARNVVFVATMHNSVYAFDADTPQATVPLWQVNLAASVPSSLLGFSDALPEVGILSTPVIDLVRQVLYVVTDELVNEAPVFRLHALALSDGHEMLNGPAVVRATVGGGTQPDGIQFDASLQLQRPGLALANGMVYLAFGSHGDLGDYHGWLIGYDASDLRNQVAVLNTSRNGSGAAIWQAGRAPAIDNDGNLFAVTGNGDFDGKANFGESALKLSGKDLSVLDWYTPANWSDLNGTDWDFGSTGAMLIPSTGQLLAGGKSGVLYLIGSDQMGHAGAGDPAAVQGVAISDFGIYNMALWDRDGGPVVYVMLPAGPLRAFRIVEGTIDPAAVSESNPTAVSRYAGIAVSSQGGLDGSAIVWQTTSDSAAYRGPGTLHAFDASDLSKELWNSNLSPDRDTLGRFAKFVAPTVANGRVYVPTLSNQLAVYGLLDSASSVSGPPQVTAVVNGASLLQGPVSPGEVITIFGANLGPDSWTAMQIDDSGHAATVLAGTQVWFDNVAAPLLFTSGNQVGAVTPFGLSGPLTNLQVQYRGQESAVVPLQVLPATPALFSRDGSGGGVGAILNQDGTLNTPDQPADRGSWVTISATGAGQTNPPGEDGKVSTDAFTSPILPVYVFIDAQLAEVSYVGSTPGTVQGFLQVVARVPEGALSGPYLSVSLYVGDYFAPTPVTLSIR